MYKAWKLKVPESETLPTATKEMKNQRQIFARLFNVLCMHIRANLRSSFSKLDWDLSVKKRYYISRIIIIKNDFSFGFVFYLRMKTRKFGVIKSDPISFPCIRDDGGQAEKKKIKR